MAVPDSIAITNNIKVDADTYFLGVFVLIVLAYIIWKIIQWAMIKRLKTLIRSEFIDQFWSPSNLKNGFNEFLLNRDPKILKLAGNAMLTPRKIYAIAAEVLLDLGKSGIFITAHKKELLPKFVIYKWGEQHLDCTYDKTLFKIWEFCASNEGDGPCEPGAVTLLGMSYLRGVGVKKDFDQAITNFKKAHDLKQYGATLMLAILSGAGIWGTPKDCDRYLDQITEKKLEVLEMVAEIRKSPNRVATCKEILNK